MSTPIGLQYDAVLALLNAALPASAKAYRMGDPAIVRDGLTTYTEVILGRRYAEATRADGSSGSELIRLTTRYVSTVERNADVQRTKTYQAIELASLSIGGLTTTPFRFEAEQQIAPDDGWFSGATDWISAL